MGEYRTVSEHDAREDGLLRTVYNGLSGFPPQTFEEIRERAALLTAVAV